MKQPQEHRKSDGRRAEEPFRSGPLPVPGSHGAIELLYVESTRELETVEPDAEATEFEIEQWEKAQPRVVADLYVKLAAPAGEMPGGQFFELMHFYGHDSYDGCYSVAFEELFVYLPGLVHIARLLGWPDDPRGTLRRLGELTPYPAPFVLPAENPSWFDLFDEEPDLTEAPRILVEEDTARADDAPADSAQNSGELERLLAEAAEAIAAGSDDEWMDCYDAYTEKESRLEQSPNFARAYALLNEADEFQSGRSHALRGDWYAANEHRWRTVARETAKCFAKAVELESENETFLEKLALAYQRAGKQAQAIKTLNALIRRDKGNDRWLYLRAISFAEKGNAERAIKEFAKVVEARPEDPRGYLAAISCLGYQAEYETAEAYAARAIELQPSALAYHSRGAATTSRFPRRKDDETVIAAHRRAADDFTRAIELADPPPPDWYYQRARAYESCGEEALAKADYRKHEELEGQGSDYNTRQAARWRWLQAEDLMTPPV